MTRLTVLTPIAPHHREHAVRAAASVAAQTVPVAALTLVDTGGRGPGWTRNRLLERVTTPFVTFLDADDWLHPDFAAQTLAAHRPGRYVFTDWWRGADGPHTAAAPFGSGDGFHLVTAVVPTAAARSVGGFDETLPGLEDRDFYLKLANTGVCPMRHSVPLVTYSADGIRSQAVMRQAATIKAMIDGRWDMGCCGDDTETATVPDTPRVLAEWVQQTSRRIQGRATGTLYRRAGHGPMRIHPDDLAAMPDVFRPLTPLPAPTPSPPPSLMNAMLKSGLVGTSPLTADAPPAARRVQPDVARVIAFGRDHYAD